MIRRPLVNSALTAAFCLTTIATLVLAALTACLQVPTFHLDGAFQTASALFRLAAGQLPGRDFLPYLGIGPNLLVYAVFWFTGGSLAGSVFAAKLAVMLLLWISLAVLSQLMLRPKPVTVSAAMATLLFFLIWWISKTSAHPAFLAALLEPGNSLRPVRAFSPYLAGIGYMLITSHTRSGVMRHSLIAALLAVVLTWSNDYSFTTALLFLAFYLLETVSQRGVHAVGAVVLTGIAAVLLYLAALWLVTGGGLMAFLHYNFVDVAGDQWWYYAPYTEDGKVYDVGGVVLILTKMGYPSLVALLGMILLASASRLQSFRLVALIGVCLAAGGLVASVGGSPRLAYFEPLKGWAAIVVLLLGIRAMGLISGRAGQPDAGRQSLLQCAVMVAAVLAGGLALSVEQRTFSEARTFIHNDGRLVAVPELGGALERSWSDYIAFVRSRERAKVFEEYSGIWNAMTRSAATFLPVDSTIHALGSIRGVAQAGLAQADYVTTTRYDLSPDWQPWGLVRNYWLYSALLAEFRPVMSSPATLVWTRLEAPREVSVVGCAASADGSEFRLDTRRPGIYEVALSYDLAPAGRFLAVVDTGIAYGLSAAGTLALDPRATHVVLPVRVAEGREARFAARVVGSSAARFAVTSCSSRRYELDDIDPAFRAMIFGPEAAR